MRSKTKEIEKPVVSQSAIVAKDGLRDSQHLMKFIEAAMQDLASGAMKSTTANAISNLAGKLLKTAELEQRYGTRAGKETRPKLLMAG